MILKSRLHWSPKRFVPPVVLALIAIIYLSRANTFGDNTSAEAPELYGCAMLVLSGIVFVLALLPSAKARETPSLITHEELPQSGLLVAKTFAIVAAFIAFVFLVGFYVAIPIFLVLFLKFVSNMSIISSALFAITALFLTWFLFSYALNLEVFTGYMNGYF